MSVIYSLTLTYPYIRNSTPPSSVIDTTTLTWSNTVPANFTTSFLVTPWYSQTPAENIVGQSYTVTLDSATRAVATLLCEETKPPYAGCSPTISSKPPTTSTVATSTVSTGPSASSLTATESTGSTALPTFSSTLGTSGTTNGSDPATSIDATSTDDAHTSMGSTQTSPSSPGLASNNSSSSATSPGAVHRPIAVMIGVGSAIAGALLAIFIYRLCVLFRRRTRKRNESTWTESDGYIGTTASETLVDEPAYEAAEKPQTAPVPGDVLPLNPPLSPEILASQFQTLNSAIKEHVERFYTTAPLDQSSGTPATSAHFSLPLSVPEELHSHLHNPTTRHPAIRSLIASSIFNQTSPSALLDRTLLPPEVLRCYEALSESIMTSRWRHALHTIFEPIYNYSEERLDSRDPRAPAINDLVTSLVFTLQPFVVPGHGKERVRDLERIVTMGARLGWEMFAHPDLWKVELDCKDGKMVVFPALIREVEEDKRREVVCDAEAVQIGRS